MRRLFVLCIAIQQSRPRVRITLLSCLRDGDLAHRVTYLQHAWAS
ncbi:hypothetical protein VTO73DRAFT_9810 [Trametes versicolor]